MSSVLEPVGDRMQSDASGRSPRATASIVRMSPTRALGGLSPSAEPTRHARPQYARLLHGLGPRFSFGGIELIDCDVESAADAVAAAGRAHQGVGVHMCNAFTLTIAMRQSSYRASLGRNALNLPDGTPVAWFYRLASGKKARGPVRGPSLMKAVLQRPDVNHFLLGGSDEVLDDLQKAIVENHGSATVVGAIAPPFRDPTPEDVEGYAVAIRESGAHVVWVGLGTPRQDQLIAELTEQVPAVLVGVGAAFDFLSGHKDEAPSVLHGTGLEWIHRLFSEPKRLWRRYLVCNLVFTRFALQELARQRKAAKTRLTSESEAVRPPAAPRPPRRPSPR